MRAHVALMSHLACKRNTSSQDKKPQIGYFLHQMKSLVLALRNESNAFAVAMCQVAHVTAQSPVTPGQDI